MQNKSLFMAGLSLLLFLASCKKNSTDSLPNKQEVAAGIYKTESFINFSKSFILDMKALADYYRTPAITNDRNTWLAAVQSAGDNDESIENVYNRHGLSFTEAIRRKNKVDNDFLMLFHQTPILLKFSETDAWEIIKEGINLGWASDESAWMEMKNLRAGSGSGLIKTNAIGGSLNRENNIDGGELWNCLKEAAGFGSAAIFGIGALQKMAADGIQAVVVNVSRWMAKRAGWIGAAVMAFEFANCVYKEAQD